MSKKDPIKSNTRVSPELFQEAVKKTNLERAGGLRKDVQFVPEMDIGFRGQNIGESKYDEGLEVGRDFYEEDSRDAERILQDTLSEHRAQSQSGGMKLLSGLGRIGVKTGTEFMKGLGYIGGSLDAALSGDIEKMTNNFFVNTFQEMEDSAKEAMPVYTRKEVQEGSLGRQLMSPEFWANEGADGIGFMLSAILTGGVTSAITKGMKIGGTIAKTIGKGANLANKIDNGIIAGAQTFVESAAETKGIVDELTHYWNQFKQPDGTYMKPDKDGNNEFFSAEDVKSIIGKAGAQTMAMNSILLFAPNLIQSKYLFGKADETLDLVARAKSGTTEELVEELGKMTPWKVGIKEGLKHGGISAGSEAFQELSQFSIENYNSKKAKGLSDANWIEGLFDGYKEGFTSIEGQKSMILGGLLGLGPGGIKAYKDSKAELNSAKGLSQLLSNNMSAFKESLTNAYQKNEDGSFKTDKEGKYLLDEKKFTEIVESASDDLMISKMYQEAKRNKEPNAMKFALNELAIKHIYPYLEIDGGLEVWDKHSSELMNIMENDAIDLGFSSGKEYSKYLKDVAIDAKSEYQKVKNYGPSFFGISTKTLLEGKETKTNVKKRLNSFKAGLEYNAVRLSMLNKTFKNEVAKIDNDIKNIENSITIEDGESFEQALNKDLISKNNYNLAKLQSAQLKKALTKIGEQYDLIFNKKEQQKAFDNLLKADEKLEEAIKEDKEKEIEKDTFRDEFYANLAEKGYNIEPSEGDNRNDIGLGKINLKNSKGDLFRISKKFNKNTQKSSFIIKNLDTKKEYPANLETIKKLGLDKAENILTQQEFITQMKAKRVETRNQNRLFQLNQLLSQQQARYNNKYRNSDKKVLKLQEELTEYQKDIEFWENSAKDLSQEDVLNEIIRLEDKIENIENEIKSLQSEKVQMERTLLTLRQLKSELTDYLEEGKEFSFEVKLKNLEEKLLNGDFDLDINNLEDNIILTEEILDELISARDVMQDTLEDLYQSILNHEEFETIIETLRANNISKKKLNAIRNKYADLLPDPEISTSDFRILLRNPESRNELIRAIKSDKTGLMSSYNLKSQDLRNIKSQMKTLNKEINKLRQNKNLLIKYEKLNINYKTLNGRNKVALATLEDSQIQKIQDKTYKKDYIEQTDEESNSETAYTPVTKHTPYSTITSFWDYDHNTGKVKLDGAGNKVKSKNYKQSKNWSDAMMSINLKEINNYSLRFVSNSGLRDLNIEPPTESADDLYVVLYNRGEVYKIDSSPVFTGIAKSDSYFNQPVDRINLTSNPTYLNALNRYNTSLSKDEEFSFTYKDNVYTSLEDLQNELISEMKEEYSSWRKGILEDLNNDANLYTSISDISAGIPILDDNVRNNPKKVLGDIEKLEIPLNTTINKVNGEVSPSKPGMIYAHTKQGQVVRVFNKRIDTLESKKQDEIINRLLKFMALSAYAENGDVHQPFMFDKAKSDKIALTGGDGRIGILDYYINWGKGSNEKFNIFIGYYGGKLAVKFTNRGVVEYLDIDDLFLDKEKGIVRQIGDPKVQLMVDFLKTKYLNVHKKATNVKLKYGFKLPTGWYLNKDGVPIITKKDYTDYNDYVLNNHLYTNIVEYDKNSDEIPNFVNQYATFDKNNIEDKPIVSEKTKEEESNKSNSLGKMRSSNNSPNQAIPVFDNVTDEINDAFNEALGDVKSIEALDEILSKEKANDTAKKEDDTKCKTSSKKIGGLGKKKKKFKNNL